MNFQNWLESHWEEDSIIQPGMSAEQALNFLKDYLLGDDWYTDSIGNGDQINTVIVEAILDKYSKRYKAEKRDIKRGR